MIIATPADGPSLGVAPSGTCTWMSRFSKIARLDAERRRRGADIGVGRLHRLLHHVAQLAGDGHPAAAGHQHGLDLQQLAADLGPGQARGDADQILELGLAVAEAADAGILVEVLGA